MPRLTTDQWETIDSAADETAALVRRHRQEWVQVAGLRQEALAARKSSQDEAFKMARLAKLAADITAVQQKGEREAWGMDGKKAEAPQGAPQELVAGADGGLTDEEFDAIAKRISH